MAHTGGSRAVDERCAHLVHPIEDQRDDVVFARTGLNQIHVKISTGVKRWAGWQVNKCRHSEPRYVGNVIRRKVYGEITS